MTNAQKTLINRAKACNAPIEALCEIVGEYRKPHPMGSTHVPAKLFIDTRTGKKISLNQAKQIVDKYEREG